MANITVKRVKESKFHNTIDDYETTGWTLASNNDRVAVMNKPGEWGSLGYHIIVFFLTVWWTFFIGNIIYALWDHYYNFPQVQIKIDGDDY